MCGEFFDIPVPDRLVLVKWFKGGEVFRSGCCFERGRGRIFYFRPGHEEHPTHFRESVRRVIANTVRWATQPGGAAPSFGNRSPLEPPSDREISAAQRLAPNARAQVAGEPAFSPRRQAAATSGRSNVRLARATFGLEAHSSGTDPQFGHRPRAAPRPARQHAPISRVTARHDRTRFSGEPDVKSANLAGEYSMEPSTPSAAASVRCPDCDGLVFGPDRAGHRANCQAGPSVDASGSASAEACCALGHPGCALSTSDDLAV